jgi:hypothetical protein
MHTAVESADPSGRFGFVAWHCGGCIYWTREISEAQAHIAAHERGDFDQGNAFRSGCHIGARHPHLEEHHGCCGPETATSEAELARYVRRDT